MAGDAPVDPLLPEPGDNELLDAGGPGSDNFFHLRIGGLLVDHRQVFLLVPAPLGFEIFVDDKPVPQEEEHHPGDQGDLH